MFYEVLITKVIKKWWWKEFNSSCWDKVVSVHFLDQKEMRLDFWDYKLHFQNWISKPVLKLTHTGGSPGSPFDVTVEGTRMTCGVCPWSLVSRCKCTQIFPCRDFIEWIQHWVKKMLICRLLIWWDISKIFNESVPGLCAMLTTLSPVYGHYIQRHGVW